MLSAAPTIVSVRAEIFESTESFMINLQCDQFDPRMKYQKLDLFKSQKVSAHSLEELEKRSDAAYEYCKKIVLARYQKLAAEIYAMRDDPCPYPIGGAVEAHPASKTNARAFEQYQERLAARRQTTAPSANPEDEFSKEAQQ